MATRTKLFLIFFISIPQWAWAQSLEDFLKSARENTATIKERMWAIEIAEERKDQATATVLPRVTAESSSVWREQANVGAFGQAYQHTALVSLYQPLFQGGSEYYALGVARNLPEIAKLEKRQEELQIFNSVAQAFYETLRAQNEVDLYHEQEKTLQDRLATLQRRAKIGRNKATDVISAQSQLARVVAERTQVERSLENAKRNLKNLSGMQSIETLVDPLKVEQLSLDPNWDSKLGDHPQIKANEMLLKNAEKEISAAKGTFLPTVDANGNYYLDRAGILAQSSWDVTLNARWNLFNGGNDSSEVRVQKLEAMQIQARLQDLQRTITNDFQSLKKEFFLHQKMVGQMKSAVDLAQKNYRQHVIEANQGLVSDLDALQALQDYLQIRRTFVQQIYEAKINHIQLKVLAGEML